MQKFKVYFWKYLPPKMFKDIKIKYKDRLKDYMNVYICDTFEEMYELTNKLEKENIEKDYGGRTYCLDKNYYDIETNKYVKTAPYCGNIMLNKDYFYMDSVSHESTHAVIGYFNRKLKDYQNIFSDIDGDNEELFCYMVGNIGNQIINLTE